MKIERLGDEGSDPLFPAVQLSFFEELPDPFNHSIDLTVRQERMHRQAQNPRTQQICIRTSRGSELGESFLPVKRVRIMDERGNTQFLQVRS